MDIQWPYKATIIRISNNEAENKTVMAFVYITGKQGWLAVCTIGRVEFEHNSLVGMGSCKQRVSAGRSGGKTAPASYSGDFLFSSPPTLSERTELSCLICAYVIIGYGDEERCYHHHQHLPGKGPTKWERTEKAKHRDALAII